MKTVWKVGLGLTVATLVGAAVFLGSRKAAAQDAAKKAFKVSDDCTTVELVDPKAAQDAIMAAGIIELRGTDEPAIDLAERIFNTMLAPCTIGLTTVFKAQGKTVPWIVVKILIGNKTVAELRDAYQNGTLELPVGAGEGQEPPDIDAVKSLLALVLGEPKP